MQLCFDLIESQLTHEPGKRLRVLDLGSQDVNGSYGPIFPADAFEYVGADLEAGPNVDVVLTDPYELPFEDGAFDLVASGQMLEHCAQFWRTFEEILRVVSSSGFVILIAPSGGPIHRFPVDCYRFYPDAYASLASMSGCHLLYLSMDERGPWNDLVGIFGKQARTLPDRPVRRHASPAVAPAGSNPEFEVRRGAASYLDVLARVHAELSPRRYLEIGVRAGSSLGLASCPAVAVDPDPRVVVDPPALLYRQTSDDFFRYDASEALAEGFDLAFIDGLHLFENALRDFMHIERFAGAETVVVVDDVLPNHPVQAQRERQSSVWCGDVWKLHDCLARYRPDLRLTLVDAEPSGLLLVSGLNPRNRTLWELYNPIVREYLSDTHEAPPQAVFNRIGVLHPDDPGVLETLRRTRES